MSFQITFKKTLNRKWIVTKLEKLEHKDKWILKDNAKQKERGKKKSTELRLKKKTIGLNYFRETSLFLIKFFKSFKK